MDLMSYNIHDYLQWGNLTSPDFHGKNYQFQFPSTLRMGVGTPISLHPFSTETLSFLPILKHRGSKKGGPSPNCVSTQSCSRTVSLCSLRQRQLSGLVGQTEGGAVLLLQAGDPLQGGGGSRLREEVRREVDQLAEEVSEALLFQT